MTTISHAFCLNCDSQVERWNRFQIEIKKLNIDVERFSAIPIDKIALKQTAFDNSEENKKSIPLKFSVMRGKQDLITILKKYCITKDGVRKRSKKELSNLQSFGEMFKIARDNGWDNVLIFEDDTYFNTDNAGLILQNALNELPENWDILYLGLYLKNSSKGKLHKYSEHLLRFDEKGKFTIWGAHAILWRYTIFDKIIDYIFNNESYRYLTDFIIASLIIPYGNVYMINPPIAFQTKNTQLQTGSERIHSSFNFDELEKECLKTITNLTSF